MRSDLLELGTMRTIANRNPARVKVDSLFEVSSGDGDWAYFTKDCWKVRLSQDIDMTKLRDGTLVGFVIKKYKNGRVWLRIKGPVPSSRRTK